ncbi:MULTISPECIES: cytosine permease [unclassified Brevibacterium]|uniref:purine-cytosine permease family protein n=1 Tax=unclassified Brevibacterium TaxID=2614124 RepID=UPI002E7B3B9E|nr:cytosine permease [Brevibacterium sp. CCUG 69071]
MNWYRRLEARLESGSDDSGVIRGQLGTGRMFMIWLAANLVVTTMLTGTLFVPGIDYTTAIFVIVLGTVLGTIVLTLIGNIGTRTGLATMAITRGAFGAKGSYLPVAANVVILMGWSWVQAMLAGISVNYVVAQTTGFSNPILFSVLCQALVVGLAILGHKGIEKAEPWFALLILLVMAYIFVIAFTGHAPAEYTQIPIDPSLDVTPALALDIVISTAISWTVLSGDLNRLAGSQRAGIVGSGLGYITSTVLAMVLGLTAFSFILLDGSDAAAFDPTVLAEEFGWALAIVIFLSVMATNTMVVYGMVNSVVGAQSRTRLKFLPVALILGAISIIGSTWLALLDQYTDFLTMIGAFFVPVFAILIVDYYLIKRGAYPRDILRDSGGLYSYVRGVNWAAVAVWVSGALVSYLLTYAYPSPVGATIPSFIVSFLLYLGLSWRSRGRFSGVDSQHLSVQG